MAKLNTEVRARMVKAIQDKGYFCFDYNVTGGTFAICLAYRGQSHITDDLDSPMQADSWPYQVIGLMANYACREESYWLFINSLPHAANDSHTERKDTVYSNLQTQRAIGDRYSEGCADRTRDRYTERAIGGSSLTTVSQKVEWYLNGKGNQTAAQRCMKGRTGDYYKACLRLAVDSDTWKKIDFAVKRRQLKP